MIRKHLVHSFALLLFIFSSQAAAQSVATQASSDQQQKAQRELERKALALVDEVLTEASNLKIVENGIRIKMTAADLLWKHDEKRARALLREAMSSLTQLIGSMDEDDLQEGHGYMFSPLQLRQEMLQILAGRDPRLAREFLRATRQLSSHLVSAHYYGAQGGEQYMELSLAAQIASSDPKQALEMARESLAKGYSYELINVLSQLQGKDHEAAAKLASEIVAKLRTENFVSNREAANMAIGLLRLASQPDEIVSHPAAKSVGKPDEKPDAKDAPPILEPQALRELTEILVAAALNDKANNTEIMMELRSMMPQVEKYAPARAAQIRSKAAEISKAYGSPGGDWAKYQKVMEEGTVEALLEAAAKAPPEMTWQLYNRAVSKVMEKGDVERARQIINEHITDPAQRRQMIAELDRQLLSAAAEQGKVDQARKLLPTLRTNEERVMMLTQLAAGAAAKGEKRSALQLLDEARGMIPVRAKNFTQLSAQLMVARAYATLEPARSFAILEPVIDQLNELLAAATILGGFIFEELVRDDEIMLDPVTQFLGGSVMQYEGDVAALALADFDRMKAVADRFQRSEIRLMARLLIAQSVLSPPVIGGEIPETKTVRPAHVGTIITTDTQVEP